MRVRRLLFAAVLLLTLSVLAYPRLAYPHLHLAALASDLPADGRPHQLALLTTRFPLPLRADDLHISGAPVELQQRSRSETAVLLRTGVTPTTVHLTIGNPRSRLTLTAHTHLEATDSFADGTPDFLRLHTPEDRAAFRRWFATLAERAADMPDAQLARNLPEITDCASLLRYAYRESLRAHDDRWYAQWPAGQEPPTLPSVGQWTYPNTPLAAGLFRVQPGPFTLADLAALPAPAHTGAFAQFADAKTLYTLNAYRLGRTLSGARPGDLIFYRLLESDSQYHSMIVAGVQSEWVVYHTGPIDKHRGEMRRVLLSDLLHHPDPRWRPTPQNPNFLGVYRWNILREP